MNQRKGNELLLLCAFLLALYLFDSVSFRNGHAWGDDFSQYIVQAQSIVEGDIGETLEVSRYRYDNSETKLIGPVLYPWGFPLLLSSVYLLSGLDILAMKLFTSLFFFLSLAVLFFLFKGRISIAQNFLIILLLGINPAFFEAKDDVLSDFPFMFFSLLTLLLIQRSLVDRRPFTTVPGDNALIGACIFISYAVRANGIILLPTLLLVQLIEGSRAFRYPRPQALKALSCLIPYATFIALVLALNSLLPSSSSYADQLDGLGVRSVIRNILLYGVMPVDFFTRSMGPLLTVTGKLLFLISIPALCLGLFKSGREHYLFFIFSGLFMSLLILWPGIQGLRYIFPVMPFYLFFLFHGLNEAAASLLMPFMKRRSILKPAVVFGSITALVFGVTIAGQAYHGALHPEDVQDGPYTADSKALFRYITKNTREQDVIIFHKPRAMWLFARRKAIRLSRLEDIMVSQAKYIACRNNDSLDMALHKKIWIARKVYTNCSFSLYARMRLSPVRLPPVSESPGREIAVDSGSGVAGHDPAGKRGASGIKKKEPGMDRPRRYSRTIEIHL